MSKKATILKAYQAIAGADADPFEIDVKADRTWLSYASGLGSFLEFCETESLAPMPAVPATIKAWMRHLHDEGYAATTVRSYYTALRHWHNRAGHPIDHRLVAETLKAIKRRSPSADRAAPLLATDLEAVIGRMNRDRPADVRDAAILLLGWAAALRQSEIAGLDWQRPGLPRDGGRGCLTQIRGGIEIVLARSKTSQESEVRLPVRDADMPSLKPWLTRWAELASLEPGAPVFRAIKPGERIMPDRLSGGAVGHIVRRRILQHELAGGASLEEAAQRAVRFRGHSLRSGFITSAALKGTPEWLIRQRSRHRSAEVCATYIRAAEQWQRSALKGLGF